MNFSELQREVKAAIGDQSPAILISVGDFVNEACGQVAEETEPPKLKEAFTVTTVTSDNHLDLSSSFSGKLTIASLGVDGDLNIVANLEALMSRYPGLADVGTPESVAVEDTVLYYQPIPATATSIYCVGYMKPDELVEDTDTPTWIPDFLHRECLVYKAAELAYTIIEDGVEGRKVNMEKYSGLYQVGRAKMQNWVNKRGRAITRRKYYV
jgi:hypothetical protein